MYSILVFFGFPFRSMYSILVSLVFYLGQCIEFLFSVVFLFRSMYSILVFFSFCLACEAETRHMYCFSGIGVGCGGGVNFFVFRAFSRKL